MTVKFSNIHHYSSLEENSEAFLYSFLNRFKTITEQNVNYDILIYNNDVLNRNMNAN